MDCEHIEPNVDLLNAASFDSDSFQGRRAFVVVSVSELSSQGRKAVNQRSADIGQETSGCESVSVNTDDESLFLRSMWTEHLGSRPYAQIVLEDGHLPTQDFVAGFST